MMRHEHHLTDDHARKRAAFLSWVITSAGTSTLCGVTQVLACDLIFTCYIVFQKIITRYSTRLNVTPIFLCQWILIFSKKALVLYKEC